MGMTLDSRADDEFYVILQAINLIENKYCGGSVEKKPD
jgi:hypothetical protein